MEEKQPTFPYVTATLLDELDKRVMVLLKDGRTLIGYLRMVDQFKNLVLHRTVERIRVGNKYGDVPRGVFVIRGESFVLVGEIDDEKDCALPLVEVSANEILDAQRREQEANSNDKLLAKVLKK